MKTQVLTQIRSMEMQEQDTPVIQKADDVLLQVDMVGVCGSDMHYYRNGNIGAQVMEFPFALGHECVATVLDAGDAVSLRPGDRVAVDPAVSCRQCDQCLSGREHTCRNLVFMGCPGQLPGCLSEYYVMPERSLYQVADTVSDEDAALVEPLSVAAYTIQQASLSSGDKIAILGAGPIGLAVALAAIAEGHAIELISDLLDYRLEVAKTLSTHALKANELDTFFGQFDVVIECCGQQSALDEGCRLLAPGGKLLIVGIVEDMRISFMPDILRRQELSIINIRRQNNCMLQAISLLTNDSIDLAILKTHVFDFSQSREAFDLVDNYADGVIKAFIRVGEQ
ncbi:MAG: alcohol dehydrogenase catalytic domain-containing protein [Lentisphaeria bacterium]|nr:alcohol dehydrogenase catalytic domain-containing protein [Lentisphaeria bacterium]NQZ66759.1 alcohol dehydrogenase catalytic domain-containing protein [Lentisphaeria bacterium]